MVGAELPYIQKVELVPEVSTLPHRQNSHLSSTVLKSIENFHCHVEACAEAYAGILNTLYLLTLLAPSRSLHFTIFAIS